MHEILFGPRWAQFWGPFIAFFVFCGITGINPFKLVFALLCAPFYLLGIILKELGNAVWAAFIFIGLAIGGPILWFCRSKFGKEFVQQFKKAFKL